MNIIMFTFRMPEGLVQITSPNETLAWKALTMTTGYNQFTAQLLNQGVIYA